VACIAFQLFLLRATLLDFCCVVHCNLCNTSTVSVQNKFALCYRRLKNTVITMFMTTVHRVTSKFAQTCGIISYLWPRSQSVMFVCRVCGRRKMRVIRQLKLTTTAKISTSATQTHVARPLGEGNSSSSNHDHRGVVPSRTWLMTTTTTRTSNH